VPALPPPNQPARACLDKSTHCKSDEQDMFSHCSIDCVIRPVQAQKAILAKVQKPVSRDKSWHFLNNSNVWSPVYECNSRIWGAWSTRFESVVAQCFLPISLCHVRIQRKGMGIRHHLSQPSPWQRRGQLNHGMKIGTEIKSL
jgi:hypothetical protein